MEGSLESIGTQQFAHSHTPGRKVNARKVKIAADKRKKNNTDMKKKGAVKKKNGDESRKMYQNFLLTEFETASLYIAREKFAYAIAKFCETHVIKFEEEKRATAFKEICEAGRAIAFEEIRAKGVCKKSFLRRSCGSKEPIGGWEVI